MARIFSGRKTDNIAFPLGGTGAGCIFIDGTGSLGGVSIKNRPELDNCPNMFAAVSLKGFTARVLEGPVPLNRIYNAGITGDFASGMGAGASDYGLPRFSECSFSSRFPFAEINLSDKAIPLSCRISAYSPFIPGDADASSLPAASLKYTLYNNSEEKAEGVFSFSAFNFLCDKNTPETRDRENGFIFENGRPYPCGFSVTSSLPAFIDTDFYKGRWWDSFMLLWKGIEEGRAENRINTEHSSVGASLSVPFEIQGKASFEIRIDICWYCPESDLKEGPEEDLSLVRESYSPRYSSLFGSIDEITEFYIENHGRLYRDTELFTSAFYDTTLPEAVTEAVAANLSILKSPTCLRQADGRFWAWEGCSSDKGSCYGTCQHVWNYAQALPHLFPELERGLREIDFNENMDEEGHQQFRTPLPIRKNLHTFYAASDGETGSIIKFYREWRISGDNQWLLSFWDKLVLAGEYCIKTWDPEEKGLFTEPHHNTYDIEFYGGEPMCSSYYLTALLALIAMGESCGKNVERYRKIYKSGRRLFEEKLFNGEYFIQESFSDGIKNLFSGGDNIYTKKEGPEYQYTNGLLSDGTAGFWLGRVSGLPDAADSKKIRSHLESVYKYNFIKDLSEHANTERSGFALGHEGGIAVCTWPKGGRPSLPLCYTDEVFTGIEYETASYLAFYGEYEKAEEIVRAVRDRYDGEKRNPYDEYECGHFYGRALSSYALIQAFTGVRYDKVEKTLYIRQGNSRSFLAFDGGFGTVEIKNGRVSTHIKYGKIEIDRIVITEKQP